ncbi:nucleobase:cation symporter-2 family protein [Salinisphaera sp.]|uniref:nucleobase:cation symporter-2 family protein n=1 Tax=Salinisphaera sp. TaxID=1914330 RepID=UPI002D79C7C4|nr:nucleobase:cation symporter-2 family protein [Salinisphaera sp.]HET7315655.1 nucleobase:cation symporter-2 family protein [Salinisphaera sp.]
MNKSLSAAQNDNFQRAVEHDDPAHNQSSETTHAPPAGRAHNSRRERGRGRPEDERYTLGASFVYGLQHVLTMYAGLLAVPLIIGQAAGLSTADTGTLITATFFMAGLATLLQTLGVPFFGSKLPLVQGVSFASVSTMVVIASGAGGIPAIFGAVIVSSAIGLAIAPVFSKLIRFFPPVVTGSVITTIGITLVPVAAHWAMGGDKSAADYGSIANIGLAALTLAIALLLSKVGSGTISRLSFLLSIVFGTLVAYTAGKTDFSGVAGASLFALPHPFALGLPTFNIAAIVSMVIVVLVILTETSADILAIGEIVGTDIDSKRVANGLRADMASSMVSPVFGSFTQSAFAQNVGLVAVTGIKSRFAVAAGALILFLMGLIPVLGAFVATIPPVVLGGAGLILFSTVAASGIRSLASVDYDNNMNLIIVAVSIGVGVIPMAAPSFYAAFPHWFQTIFHSGISAAAIVAVTLNLLFNHFRWGTPQNPSVFAAGTNRQIKREVVDALEEGDYCENGKVLDADGNEIPVVSNESAA